jgi:hypothetical protein
MEILAVMFIDFTAIIDELRLAKEAQQHIPP